MLQKYIFSSSLPSPSLKTYNFVCMKSFPLRFVRWGIEAFLLVLVILCRYWPAAGEVYARYVYPVCSTVLSALVAWIPFSVEEWLVIAFCVLFIGLPFWARRKKKGWKWTLRAEAEVLVVVYLWFYWGWGINYFRKDFFNRSAIEPVAYVEEDFHRFLTTYTDSLNAACTTLPLPAHDEIEQEVKQLYAQVPSRFGLSTPRSYQHPKPVAFNALYSGVGVLGYMGPFFAESQLNRELPPLQWPFTYAHEYAHLLGVSSEAEANFWAYQICIRSQSPAVRYAGYFGLLPYVLSNAAGLLDDDAYCQLLQSIRPEVIQTLREKQAYWEERYSPWVGRIQEQIYEWYLKGNQISSGQKNYGEVIAMVLSLPADWWK